MPDALHSQRVVCVPLRQGHAEPQAISRPPKVTLSLDPTLAAHAALILRQARSARRLIHTTPCPRPFRGSEMDCEVFAKMQEPAWWAQALGHGCIIGVPMQAPCASHEQRLNIISSQRLRLFKSPHPFRLAQAQPEVFTVSLRKDTRGAAHFFCTCCHNPDLERPSLPSWPVTHHW